MSKRRHFASQVQMHWSPIRAPQQRANPSLPQFKCSFIKMHHGTPKTQLCTWLNSTHSKVKTKERDCTLKITVVKKKKNNKKNIQDPKHFRAQCRQVLLTSQGRMQEDYPNSSLLNPHAARRALTQQLGQY